MVLCVATITRNHTHACRSTTGRRFVKTVAGDSLLHAACKRRKSLALSANASFGRKTPPRRSRSCSNYQACASLWRV